ncbi:MAG: hypothetical protein QOE70_4227 [Chthoniobacter sp.]|jgi:hypothetical protein|nr:hypothetical protein [Chthoniobacter sp.]
MNDRVRHGTVGILPVGALGVGFFFHLTRGLDAMDERVCFIERSGSTSAEALRTEGALRIAVEGGVRRVPAERACRPGLLACAESGWLPEVLLVCTQSNQILPVITNFVELLEWLHAAEGIDAAVAGLPLLVLCSNGIYHLRVRRFLVEALEESTLYGRLPDLWSEPMGRIVGKLLRGVTIQTGQREGHGAGAIYRPGPPGRTRLAGGEPAHRRRCGGVLQSLGGWFEVAEDETPTRVEFDKALINLFGNLLGQLQAIDEAGAFRLLQVGDILPEPDSAETRELARHVIAVGRAVHAYRPEEDFETLYRSAMGAARGPLGHVPSSLQWIETQLRAGTLEARITPTEKWLLDPLIRYASTAGLDESTRYFTGLIGRIEERLVRAIAAQAVGQPAR